MRVIPIASALFLVGGCAGPADETADTSDDAAATQEEAAYFTMGPGLYDIEGGEGVVYASTELREDGTYSDFAGSDVVGGGTWAADGSSICFDPEGDGEDQQERCWTNSPLNNDGSFVTTRDDGSESYTVRPRDAG